jgi:glucokinase
MNSVGERVDTTVLESPPREMRILVGDIGGTNTRLALFEDRENRLQTVHEAVYSSSRFDGLGEAIESFLADRGTECERACFGIAGPVDGRRVRVTNLPWVVDADEIAARFGLASVLVINDLEAVASGLELLRPVDFFELNPGREAATGNLAVIAPGTGLGQAGVLRDGHEYRPFACEGGHASFAPQSEEQWELLEFLKKRHQHVSWERVVSGPGLESIHEFIRERTAAPVPDWLIDEMERLGAAPVIAREGLAGSSETCSRALRLFVGLYGDEAGNLALKLMATGGVYLAGGMTQAIVPALGEGRFMDAFLAKGRMRRVLEGMPVRVVLDEMIGLRGAALYARRASDRLS